MSKSCDRISKMLFILFLLISLQII